MTIGAWWAVGVAAVISLLLPFGLRPLLRTYGVIDQPTSRSSHAVPTLRGGGIAPLSGFTVGCVVTAAAGLVAPTSILMIIGGGAVAAALVGLAEDVRGLPVLVRAGAQLVIGIVVASLLGTGSDQPWWALAFASIAIMFYTNATNFMDGIDGISGLHGVAVGLAYGWFGSVSGLPWMMFLGVLLAAVFAAFLPWNVSPRGLFLGDVGSYLLGAAIAGIAVGALFFDIAPIVVLSPLAIYLADTVVCLLLRAGRGEPVLRPHRMHAYQRLADTGLRHWQVSTIVTAFTGATIAIGSLVLVGVMPVFMGWAFIVVACVSYLALPRLRGSRLPVRPTAPLMPINVSGPYDPRPAFAPDRWVVLGASGFVGNAIAERLLASGHLVTRVAAPRLDLDPSITSPDAVARIARDHSQLPELENALHGSHVVINAAGLATPDAPASRELYGANALLPALVACAAELAGCPRVVHLSTAAVQGRRRVLDDAIDAAPFSPYSRSKALGERAALASVNSHVTSDVIVIRATSVQGIGRPTTRSLKRIACSPLASVAGDGSQPTVVSSIDGLVDFVIRVSASNGAVAPILLQPWEGFSANEVLRLARGSEPRKLPRWLCTPIVGLASLVGRVVPEVAGAGRRVELMWMGQQQIMSDAGRFPAVPRAHLEAILSSPEPTT